MKSVGVETPKDVDILAVFKATPQDAVVWKSKVVVVVAAGSSVNI